jgi:tetrahedral aminopeptidase
VGTIGLEGRFDPNGKLPSFSDMFVDVGAGNAADVHVAVGDVATFLSPFVAQGNGWFAPNLDDRIGCAALVELLRRLKGQSVPNDLYIVFTSQEEVGPRGAVTAAYAIEPDVAVAVDVTGTGDFPYARPMAVALGAGPAVKVQDSGMISHSGLNSLLKQAAESAGVAYQLEVLNGGTTDASGMQISRAGIPASCISIPSRYIHTPSQIVDARDVEGAVRLLETFVRRPMVL